jgi:hypothetical protein
MQYGPPVHWWDRLPDLPNALVDWAQLAGTILSLLALVLALLALVKAKKDLAAERLRQHDLDILREMGKSVNADPTHFRVSPQLVGLLPMLPIEDFPLTRAALMMPTTPEATRRFDKQLDDFLTPELQKTFGNVMADDVCDALAWGRATQYESWKDGARSNFTVRLYVLACVGDSMNSTFLSELSEAVTKRVKA